MFTVSRLMHVQGVCTHGVTTKPPVRRRREASSFFTQSGRRDLTRPPAKQAVPGSARQAERRRRRRRSSTHSMTLTLRPPEEHLKGSISARNPRAFSIFHACVRTTPPH